MRMPEQVAGLGFESSSGDTVSETVEIAQTVDVAAPDVQPDVPSEPTSGAPTSMPSATSLSTSALGASGVTAPASASSIASSADRAATSGTGKPSLSKVSTSFFGAGAGGNNFCYVIDGSESMRGGPWEAARAELIRSVASLKENQRFYIVFFNQELSLLPEPGKREPASTSLYATKENIEHAINWIESLKVARGAPPTDALKHAIELEPDAIYFLADGATKIDVPGFLKKLNRTDDFISGEQIRVPIHAIAFYSPEEGQSLMRKIAAENKGQFIYVPAPTKR